MHWGPTMSITITHYSRDTITDDVILARAAHAGRMHAEEMPEDPPLIVADALQRVRNLPTFVRLHTWIVREDGHIVADATLNWAELDSNREAANVDVSVEPHLRRRGLGVQLLALAVAGAAKVGRPKLYAGCTDRLAAGALFLERLGFAPGLTDRISQLDLARLDHALIARWQAEGPARAPGYDILQWDGPTAEDRIDAFAALANVMNSAPRGDLDIEDTKVTPQIVREGERCMFANGGRRHLACARHVATGELAGYTELYWTPNRPTIVWQGATGVAHAHRGRRLGRWLKAVDMTRLLAANPDARFVRTGNATSNAPMLAINEAMGFAPFIAQTIWQGQAPVISGAIAAWQRASHRVPLPLVA